MNFMSNIIKFGSTILITAAAIIALAPSTFADQSGYYIVQGQSDDFTLNLRASPYGDIISTYSKGAVIVSDGETKTVKNLKWLKIYDGQQQGWMAAQYLQPAKAISLDQSRVAIKGICQGEEPYWQISWNQNKVSLSIDDQSLNLTIGSINSAQGHFSPNMLSMSDENTTTANMIITDQTCTASSSDGFVFGAVNLILNQQGKSRLFTGCCQPVTGAYK